MTSCAARDATREPRVAAASSRAHRCRAMRTDARAMSMRWRNKIDARSRADVKKCLVFARDTLIISTYWK